MIEIKNVTKRYGTKLAVNDVTFSIQKGEILGFLGRNGAGKTTTMNIVTGYISSTSGTVSVDGYEILQNPREVKRRIGYLPEQPPVYLDMTVSEYLRFVCEIKGVPRANRSAHIKDICALVKIEDVYKRLIKNLSKGYRQRVGLAQALVGNPPYIIMDEPTVGLDPKQIIEIRRLIRDLGKEHTVVLSSHLLHEVADVCDRVVIINNGEIVVQETLEELSHRSGAYANLILTAAGDEKRLLKEIRSLNGVQQAQSMPSKDKEAVDFHIEYDRNTDIRRALFNTLSRMGAPILQLRTLDMTLEDIFMQVTSDVKEG